MIVPFGRSVTLVHRTPGGFSAGRELPPTEVEVTIVGTVQPPSRADLEQRKARGLSEAVARVIYTSSEIKTADEQSGGIADHIVYAGTRFEVVAVEPEDTTGAPTLVNMKHWKGFLRRVDPA